MPKSNTWEEEAGIFMGCGQSRLHCVFEFSQSYIARHFLKKKNFQIGLSYDPTYRLLTRRIENKIFKRYLYTHVDFSIIHNSQEVETA